MFIFRVYTQDKKPDTFGLPLDEERMSYNIDDIVKVVINSVPSESFSGGEKIWVRILEEIDEFGYYEATWANVPLLQEAMELKFFPIHYTNIISYWGKAEKAEKPNLEVIKGGKDDSV